MPYGIIKKNLTNWYS